MQNKSLNIFLISAGIFLVASFFSVQAQTSAPIVQADLAPSIFVSDLHVTGISGNEISGDFTVTNKESYYLSDLNYEIKLFQGNNYADFKLIDVTVPKEIFFVAPGATIKKTFKYTYPKNINSGDYTLRAQIITTRGTELGWNDLTTPLTGANKFLDIHSELSKVIVDSPSTAETIKINSENARPQQKSASIVSTNTTTPSTPKVAVPTNAPAGTPTSPKMTESAPAPKKVAVPPTTNKTVSPTAGDFVVPQVTISARPETSTATPPSSPLPVPTNNPGLLNVGDTVTSGHQVATPLEGIIVSLTDNVFGYLEVSNPGDSVTVVPHVKIFKRQINMSVAKEYNDTAITFAKGETKVVTLKMPKLDVPESYLAEVKFYQNNQQVSGIQYFRWVVEGLNGKILYIKADKDYYKAGDNINLTIQTTGPADASDPGMGKLEVLVSKSNNKVIAQSAKDVNLGGGLVLSDISIPIKEDIIAPIINVKLTKDGKILDQQTINLPIFSPQAKAIENKQWVSMMYVIGLICLAILIVLIAGFIFYKRKIKKNK